MIGMMTRHCQRNPMYTSPRYHNILITISSHWPFCNPSFYFQETGVSATYPSASTASSLPKTQWRYPLNPLSHTPLHPPLHPLLPPPLLNLTTIAAHYNASTFGCWQLLTPPSTFSGAINYPARRLARRLRRRHSPTNIHRPSVGPASAALPVPLRIGTHHVTGLES
jgi:hypothetical protein